jgi:hypothetical protein
MVLAPVAGANVPAPLTVTNTMRSAALGNAADGTLSPRR